jgi:hypothetical protein
MTAVGWSLFLACSWTWCIGMYLPLIVMRNYGWWGFLVFAVPNIIGCSAFGYVMATRTQSRRFERTHRGAALSFSLVTAAFHMFFVPMLLRIYFDAPAHVAIGTTLGVYVVAALLSRLSSRVWLYLSALVYAGSILAMLAVLASGGFEPGVVRGRFDGTNLVFLALPSLFGFALCPYLDLTFHRALRESPSRHGFFGFGVTFAIMIVFTAVYFSTGLEAVVLGHVLAQATFTTGAHLRELGSPWPAPQRPAPLWMAILPLAAIPLTYLPLPELLAANDGAYLFELPYQGFMLAYALVFPAYLFVFAGRRPLLRRTPRHLQLWGLLVIASAPALYAGFVAHIAWPIAIPAAGLAVWFAAQRLASGRHDVATSATAS